MRILRIQVSQQLYGYQKWHTVTLLCTHKTNTIRMEKMMKKRTQPRHNMNFGTQNFQIANAMWDRKKTTLNKIIHKHFG